MKEKQFNKIYIKVRTDITISQLMDLLRVIILTLDEKLGNAGVQ